MQWLVTHGTNSVVIQFLDNNSFLLLFLWGLIMLYLKYRAKKTPSPDDDALVQQIEDYVGGKIGDVLHRRTGSSKV